MTGGNLWDDCGRWLWVRGSYLFSTYQVLFSLVLTQPQSRPVLPTNPTRELTKATFSPTR